MLVLTPFVHIQRGPDISAEIIDPPCLAILSQHTLHGRQELCAKFHAFCKKCTIFCYAALQIHSPCVLLPFCKDDIISEYLNL